MGLSVGGTPITVSGQQVPLGPLGTLGVATVNIDETINTGSGVTQRAVDITIAGGLDGGAQIVLGEASAGADGNPCTTSGGGTGGGGPIGGGPGGYPAALHAADHEIAVTLVDEDPHGLLVAEPGPGGQGVGQV